MKIHEMIVNLQKVRKEVDKLSIDLEEYPMLSACASDVSYGLTISIKDLIRINKVVKKSND